MWRAKRSAIKALVVAFLTGAVGGLACSAPPVPPLPLIVRVRSDGGERIVDAAVFQGTTLLAKTDAEGAAHLDVNGREGESFYLQVRCPPAYRSPEQPLEVRRLNIVTTKVPEYEVRCVKLRHSLVVAIRAENGPNLPVIYLEKEVARTDAFGAAHVSFEMNVHDRVELTLRTEGKEYAKAHPQNPVSVFEMPGHDDIQTFAVTFTRDARKSPPRPPAAPTIRAF